MIAKLQRHTTVCMCASFSVHTVLCSIEATSSTCIHFFPLRYHMLHSIFKGLKLASMGLLPNGERPSTSRDVYQLLLNKFACMHVL